MDKPQRLDKASMLGYWRSMADNQPLEPQVVPYKHKGSTYSEDGIRITGSRAWIDSVLSRLKPLLEYEGIDTRLQVNYAQSTNRETGQPIPDAWNCYVQVHQRGREGQMLQAYSAWAKRARKQLT